MPQPPTSKNLAMNAPAPNRHLTLGSPSLLPSPIARGSFAFLLSLWERLGEGESDCGAPSPHPSPKGRGSTRAALLVAIAVLVGAASARTAAAQLPELRHGAAVPKEVRDCYDRALEYLATTQGESGDWQQAGQQGPGITGLCLLALLASGEDPNFGPYSRHVRKALASIIQSQDARTGCIGPGNMYHHGFAMLALAEAYGAVDDRNLWQDGGRDRLSIGQSLELAVHCAITSQDQNPFGGWRYSPNAPTPIRRSAAPCSSASWRRETPASRRPTRTSSGRWPTINR